MATISPIIPQCTSTCYPGPQIDSIIQFAQLPLHLLPLKAVHTRKLSLKLQVRIKLSEHNSFSSWLYLGSFLSCEGILHYTSFTTREDCDNVIRSQLLFHHHSRVKNCICAHFTSNAILLTSKQVFSFLSQFASVHKLK